MNERLVSVTKIDTEYLKGLETDMDLSDCERLMVYIARVSSPNPLNESYKGLLRYCLKNNHWSVFETVNMVIEIETTRAVSAQILRHRSFTFQEFSQRYAPVQSCSIIETRLQDTKNRQSSIEECDVALKNWWISEQKRIQEQSFSLYNEALSKGIAKEVARYVLPMSSNTKLFMNGSIRSWIHYIELRTKKETQKEHRMIAEKCKEIFCKQFPVCSEALGWI